MNRTTTVGATTTPTLSEEYSAAARAGLTRVSDIVLVSLTPCPALHLTSIKNNTTTTTNNNNNNSSSSNNNNNNNNNNENNAISSSLTLLNETMACGWSFFPSSVVTYTAEPRAHHVAYMIYVVPSLSPSTSESGGFSSSSHKELGHGFFTSSQLLRHYTYMVYTHHIGSYLSLSLSPSSLSSLAFQFSFPLLLSLFNTLLHSLILLSSIIVVIIIIIDPLYCVECDALSLSYSNDLVEDVLSPERKFFSTIVSILSK
jgi:hypothetical protein